MTSPAPTTLRRGPWSEAVLDVLDDGVASQPARPEDPFTDHDMHLALYLCYELSFGGVPGVDDEMEWSPELITLRTAMERMFEDALLDRVGAPRVDAGDVPTVLRSIDAASTMPLARYLQTEATLEQVREFVAHRSAYHLKEADPHTFAIPRLRGAAKAAFVEIQFDEYGSGRPERMHSELFVRLMTGLGLDPTPGAYLSLLPGPTLATVNLMSLFGFHRRWRGAAVGHLALFELGSSRPNRLYGDALRRHGFGPDVTDFHDEHVTADAAHAMIATYDLAGRLALDEPGLAGDIVFGALVLDAVEASAGGHLLDAWREGGTSLLGPLP